MSQVHVVQGQFRGINLKCIDTPGLAMSGSSLTGNNRALHAIRKAMRKHKPDLVLYVDRNDVVSSRVACIVCSMLQLAPSCMPVSWLSKRKWSARSGPLPHLHLPARHCSDAMQMHAD